MRRWTVFPSLMNTPLITAPLSNWKRACSYVAYSSAFLGMTFSYYCASFSTYYSREENKQYSLHFKVSKTITKKNRTLLTFVWNECKARRLLHLQYRQVSRVPLVYAGWVFQQHIWSNQWCCCNLYQWFVSTNLSNEEKGSQFNQ